MNIVTIVGARPQFIKAAAVSRVLRKEHKEILVHTGQHYDTNMSDIFFKELQIPKPDVNLAIGSGSHARQTAAMMVGIEDVLFKEKPDFLMVYGDTNSTLAGAVTASKLHIPIIHVEAGLRSFNMDMPEEINRILTDRISTLLFCPTETAVNHLAKEGLRTGVYNIGDVMCDAVLFYSREMEAREQTAWFARLKFIQGTPEKVDKWYLATIHRAENADSPQKTAEILFAFETLEYPVIFPVHPRTRTVINSLYSQRAYRNILFVEPMGYLDMLYFTKNAVKVITDSGGLQKEAYMLDTPCVTVREQTEWIETLCGNHNILAHAQRQDIIDKVKHTNIDFSKKRNWYGSGNAADKLCKILRGAL